MRATRDPDSCPNSTPAATASASRPSPGTGTGPGTRAGTGTRTGTGTGTGSADAAPVTVTGAPCVTQLACRWAAASRSAPGRSHWRP
ncbi:hypothetical protein E3T23_07185 [Cryobacterium cheniae]|uniref:Uncharacterized protein n=1 Tax=Cryobacterium cheniae TaxID=1259262 RepID=A0A4R8XR91_9MICO|nr:hypothetical protein E3T23_07185 [Cryobacterium cheniae]